jgi:hypothetical protein
MLEELNLESNLLENNIENVSNDDIKTIYEKLKNNKYVFGNY